MKLRLTSLLLVILFVMALAVVPAVGAQDECLGLNSDDCAIFMNAANMDMTVNSGNLTYDFSLDVGGLAMLVPGSDGISITSSGTGAFSYDPTSEDPTAITLQLDTTNSFSDGTTSDGGDFNFRIVDGFFYMQDPESGQWIGFELEAAMDQGALPVDPSMLGDASGGFDPGMFSELLTGLGITDVAVEDVVSLTREADQDMMGQTMYVFTLSMDFGPVFQSASFQQTVTALMSMAGSDDPSMAQMGAMIGPLLQNASLVINVTEFIGADDGYVHGITFTLDSEIDLSALFGAAGAGGAAGGASVPQMPPININMVFNVTFDNINGDVTVTAPEGAEIIDPSEFQGLGGLGF